MYEHLSRHQLECERGEKLLNGDGSEPLSMLSNATLHTKAGILLDLQSGARVVIAIHKQKGRVRGSSFFGVPH